MQWLAAICIRRPVFATVIVLVLTVLGTFSYFGLGVDRFPKIDFPFVVVNTVLPGSAPQEVELELSDKIESAVNTISGIEELRSYSVEGLSQVIVQFTLEKDADVAAQEVREKIDLIMADLPKGVEPPTVMKMDPDAAPVLTLAISSSKGDVRAVTEFADKVVRRELESASGVGQATLIGGRLRQINIWIDPDKLQKYNLSASAVTMSLAAQNIELPAGRMEQGDKALTVRTSGRVQSVDQMKDIMVAMRDGYSVRLGDVAEVQDGMAEPESVGFRGTNPAVLLNVRKQSGTNTIEVVAGIKERLKNVEKRLPEGYKIEIARDQSEFVENSVHAVKEHLVLGALFAAIIVFLFLANARSTLISAIAIPTSIIATFTLMNVAGFTLNGLTLLALTLSVGIVIDDAIVVLENIYRWIEEKGMSPWEAAFGGTKEIGLAVLATTLSLIAVFLPVAFMSGIIGRFLNSFGLTMAFAIAVSLVVSFTLTPMLSARFLKRPDHQHDQGPAKKSPLYGPIERLYMRMLRWSMAHRWAIVLACFVALFSIPVIGRFANVNFLPVEDESQFGVTVRAPEGTSLDQTRIIATRMATELEKMPGVAYSLTTIGDDPQLTQNLATLYVKLLPPTQRNRTQEQIIDASRREVLPKFASENLRTSVGPIPAFGGGAQAQVAYMVQGPDMQRLSEITLSLLERLKKIPGVVDPDTTLLPGRPEIRAQIDRKKASDLGVSVADVASTLQLLVGGYKVSTYNEGGEQYEVFARALSTYRSDAQGLARMTVPTMKLGAVTLDNVVNFTEGSGPSRIERFNRQRQFMLTCNLEAGSSQQKVLDELDKAVKEVGLPAGYSAGPIGSSKELAKAAKGFMLAFLLSFIFMYLVLAAQFESWLHPLTILISLPLTVPFAIISVIIFRQSLNIFSMLGILVLFGVVKKNSILQIDHTIKLRASGLPRFEAIMEANRDRLRPILMTTVAFVAGMIPLVVSSGAGSGANRATGFVIIGGQTLALLLTLLATPVTYSLFDDLSVKLKKLLPASWQTSAAPPGEGPHDGPLSSGLHGHPPHQHQPAGGEE
ncbi:efflux RND transporter permease subunit [Chondromyces apiculatus]|uniref:RND multidrug efflux transporter / Acriflavin resistance protein n=1 Tax=Chondromyces apiculatus DSM 436 TaxID=1192034 RepID=A0A017T087_9BACT|nr:efflux RND transporter permease subunit [Chondromyces apiculatus]EYF02422.1 RND multidrug efflux transporter / Acriflavin resistance protein [Chondromyces apiculatus DSM 436]